MIHVISPQAFFQRALACKDVYTSKVSCLVGGLFALSLGIPPMLIGIAGTAAGEDDRDVSVFCDVSDVCDVCDVCEDVIDVSDVMGEDLTSGQHSSKLVWKENPVVISASSLNSF